LVRPDDEVERDLVHLVVEKTLIKVSGATCDLVGATLQQKYGCYFDGCLEHPEYLLDVLGAIYGTSAKTVVQSILDEVNALSMTPKLEQFHSVLARFVC
jgi:hypothetical protein